MAARSPGARPRAHSCSTTGWRARAAVRRATRSLQSRAVEPARAHGGGAHRSVPHFTDLSRPRGGWLAAGLRSAPDPAFWPRRAQGRSGSGVPVPQFFVRRRADHCHPGRRQAAGGHGVAPRQWARAVSYLLGCPLPGRSRRRRSVARGGAARKHRDHGTRLPLRGFAGLGHLPERRDRQLQHQRHPGACARSPGGQLLDRLRRAGLRRTRLLADRQPAFGLNPHEYRVSEADAVQAIGQLVRAYDEPFGNASAIPTYYCARIAADTGVSMMIAGDGGDEIFGGNERYFKDKIFEAFHTAPAWVRGLGHGAAAMLKGSDSRFANRVKNFVHRASLPNPDRFYSDDSFASDHFDELLSADFRSRVGIDDALDVQRRIYAQASADCTLHRLMYLDLKMTIADNDVVKVVRAARSAGVDVMFPYLDPRLIEFTGRLPGSDKVRGNNKRHLFKLATEHVLPEAIRKKKKQGFGLPISVWLRRNGPYGALAHDVVLSDRALQRGYAQPDFIRHLIRRHQSGAWDHSPEIHSLMMLELWHREFVDDQP
ncbi:hypothetical protein FSC37_12905 [Piscinibacter aquaticus]|uniref:asparagine synthase (glutamine-hydrolyzing) n=1 Tax=Piscinibacter aquaticus TaxID=392597 RepID=A0A5C6U0M7_9BURK|nr:hypothetical protein FSC37_12905 [Piscinibacter aquaticus]